MPILPADVITLLVRFAPVFFTRAWRHIPLHVVVMISFHGRELLPLTASCVGQRTEL